MVVVFPPQEVCIAQSLIYRQKCLQQSLLMHTAANLVLQMGIWVERYRG